MLTALRIRNFKAWRDTGQVRMAPLTVIFGANSAGKSSLGHLMLGLKQTVQSSDRRRAFHFGDPYSLIDLGTFADCVHGHDLSRAIEFSLEWRMPEAIAVRNPVAENVRFSGDHLRLEVALQAGRTGQPEVSRMQYSLDGTGERGLAVEFRRGRNGEWQLRSEQYGFSVAPGRKWPLEAPEKFYRISDTTRARFQNADFLTDFALATEGLLSRFYYLGPLREAPKRTYQWTGDTPEDVGQRGELAVAAILAAEVQGRRLSRASKLRSKPFTVFIAGWLKELGIIHSFDVRAVAEGRREYEVLLRSAAGAPEVKITDVGFGVSQVLPALVLPFYCPPDSVVWMEQPEIHLHPQAQAELADVFISAVQARESGKPRNVQLIVESHSEHFLNRLQRRIAEEAMDPKDVAIHFCRKGGTRSAELEPLRLNELGDIGNWPENFFGNEMEDLTARTVAAARRHNARSAE